MQLKPIEEQVVAIVGQIPASERAPDSLFRPVAGEERIRGRLDRPRVA